VATRTGNYIGADARHTPMPRETDNFANLNAVPFHYVTFYDGIVSKRQPFLWLAITINHTIWFYYAIALHAYPVTKPKQHNPLNINSYYYSYILTV
jgi:hypothetical protein